ncbi:MAG: hypothetical protein HY300_17135 [Verrucomicrobia bacterium]|nr:hypothetical protein [Verrucomicrobiota bacterium]
MKTKLLTLAAVLGATLTLAAQTKPVYENNFEKAEVDKVPSEFLVLDGAFAVKQDGANKFLELPGAPLDTFGVLFGPTEPDGLCVQARVNGTGKGRRFPTIAVGINGVGGYKLQISPSKKQLELYRGEDAVANVPFEWQSGAWTVLRLQLRKVKDGTWKLEGKAWAQSAKEPAQWMISWEEKQTQPAGRPSIWGNPYAGTPIQFDDLVVTKVN